jgi:hypothetical protein
MAFRTTTDGYFHRTVAKAKAGELNLARTIWRLRAATARNRTGRPGRGPASVAALRRSLAQPPGCGRAAHPVGETGSEFLAPASHRLVGGDDAALSQEKLNIPQAEHVLQPDGVADEGEPVAVVGLWWRLHAASFAGRQACGQTRLP